jgi:hypothetical protein
MKELCDGNLTYLLGEKIKLENELKHNKITDNINI